MNDAAAADSRRPIRCHFINLADAAERRAAIEASFRAAAPAAWTLQRVAAVSAAEAAEQSGSLPSAEKACFLSHRRAVEESLAHDDDALILEDDAALSARGLDLLSKIASLEGPWDLLLPNPAPVSVGDVYRYARQREVFEIDGKIWVDDLARVPFVGADAYLVRARSKRKLLALIEAAAPCKPFDVALSALVVSGALKAVAPVPFLTTLGAAAEASQIPRQETISVEALTAFRRLLFVDRDLAACDAALGALTPRTSRPGARLGVITAALFSEP